VEFANKGRGVAAGILAFAATAALVYFGNGFEPRWPLMWIAPLPVLWLALRSRWWSAALVSGLALLTGCLNLWGYLRALHAPPTVWLAVFGIEAAAFALAVLLFRALALRGAIWSALVAFPAAVVAFEFARNLLGPHGTGGSLAYSQIRCLPFLQLASVTGPWGITFVLLLFPAGVALAVHLRASNAAKSERMLTVTLAITVAVWVFGAVRLAVPQQGPNVRVGLAASDHDVAPAGAPTNRLLDGYAADIQTLAAQGAQVVVLPEKIGMMDDSAVAGEDAILQRLADRTGTTIVAGFDREMAGEARNQARVYRPGAVVATYNKEHLLPPFELKFTPGTRQVLLPEAADRWGVAICKDMDFTGLSRTYGRDGAGLMLVPAWDFNIDRAWHGHIAIMRGVEDGFSIVRAAKNGYLTVSDNRGRILAERRSDAAAFAALLANVPSGHSRTVFLLLGDWFGWLCMALTVWGVARLVI